MTFQPFRKNAAAQLILPGDHQETLHYCARYFVSACQEAIKNFGTFTVALAGGSTPKAVYQLLCAPPYSTEIEWEKIHLFWSDERAVPPISHESNYSMIMKAGFEKMPIPPSHIHRMIAEESIQQNAQKYEHLMREILNDRWLDLVILGMGEDGHTASLFPSALGMGKDRVKVSLFPPAKYTSFASGKTHRFAVACYIPSKKSWRMTLTLEAINAASTAIFYVFGSSKAHMLAHVFDSDPHLPCQFVGTPENPALWIADQEASALLAR